MGVISDGTTMLDSCEFENLPVVNWDTTAKTSNFTAVAGNGYFVNTTSGAITVTLPASPSAGDQVAIKDYAGTAGTNNITIARNGSKISGVTSNAVIDSSGGKAVFFLYVDATQGWSQIITGDNTNALVELYPVATGGTITTSGNFKIHTFTGPGTFCVSCAGSPLGSNQVDYLVIGGGAGGAGGGGGAGGYRFSNGTASGCYSAGPAPLGASAITLSATAYPISVGAGGAGGNASSTSGTVAGSGTDSIFNTITSSGGGRGGLYQGAGGDGGSGGGGGKDNGAAGGSGNTPSFSPPQGNDGGTTGGGGSQGGSGGGGASAAGTGGSGSETGGPGGNGLASSINASPVTRGGGGGGGTNGSNPGSGGSGGGGNGGTSPGGSNGQDGTANTGGGGGAGRFVSGTCSSGDGGSGLVIIRYKFQ